MRNQKYTVQSTHPSTPTAISVMWVKGKCVNIQPVKATRSGIALINCTVLLQRERRLNAEDFAEQQCLACRVLREGVAYLHQSNKRERGSRCLQAALYSRAKKGELISRKASLSKVLSFFLQGLTREGSF